MVKVMSYNCIYIYDALVSPQAHLYYGSDYFSVQLTPFALAVAYFRKTVHLECGVR
jgi:hypothetical protein